jgi:hypothetical protein
MDDFEYEQERHRRRIMLMRMAGDTNQMERRRDIMIVLAISLFIGAVLFSITVQ